ncbi:hypothetical protein [Butyrivibrio sp. VCB2006]|uniref:hypothetical protein n=1 Tax=Butyrivibrio sp. VCB2006 TaxID=1280679 RepID=UPI0003FD8EAB|nr:hypothetical protein [Butyrivibrio sp. VCB2006]
MGRRKNKYTPKHFESSSGGGKFINQLGKEQPDTSSNIYESMLQSKQFKSLTNKQKILYVYCKSQYYGKRKPKHDYEKQGLYQEESYFYFNIQRALDYDLYTKSGHSDFYKDMKALEEKGFIKKIKSGKAHKEKNIYQFSGEWWARE